MAKPGEKSTQKKRSSDVYLGKLTGRVMKFPSGDHEPTPKEFFDMNSEHLFPYSDRYTPSSLFHDKLANSDSATSSINLENRRHSATSVRSKYNIDTSSRPFNIQEFIDDQEDLGESNHEREFEKSKTMPEEPAYQKSAANAELISSNHMTPDRDGRRRDLAGFREKLSSKPLIKALLSSGKISTPSIWKEKDIVLSPEAERNFKDLREMMESNKKEVRGSSNFKASQDNEDSNDLNRLRKKLKEIKDADSQDNEISLAWLGAGKLSPITNKGETSFFSNKRDMKDVVERDLAQVVRDFEELTEFDSDRKRMSSTVRSAYKKSLASKPEHEFKTDEKVRQPSHQMMVEPTSPADHPFDHQNHEQVSPELIEEPPQSNQDLATKRIQRKSMGKENVPDQVLEQKQKFPDKSAPKKDQKENNTAVNNEPRERRSSGRRRDRKGENTPGELTKMFDEAEQQAQKLDKYVSNFVTLEEYINNLDSQKIQQDPAGDYEKKKKESASPEVQAAEENPTKQHNKEKKKVKVGKKSQKQTSDDPKEEKKNTKDSKQSQESKKGESNNNEEAWYASNEKDYDDYFNKKQQRPEKKVSTKQPTEKIAEEKIQPTKENMNDANDDQYQYLTVDYQYSTPPYARKRPRTQSSSNTRSNRKKNSRLKSPTTSPRPSDKKTKKPGRRGRAQSQQVERDASAKKEKSKGTKKSMKKSSQEQKAEKSKKDTKIPKEKKQRGRKRNANAIDELANAFTEKTLAMREEVVQLEKGYYGEQNRYPKRVRIPPLIGWANERVEATYDKDGNPIVKVIRVDLEAMRNEESRFIRNHHPLKKTKVSPKKPASSKDEKRVQVPTIKVIPPPKEKETKKGSKAKQGFSTLFDQYLDSLADANINYEVVSEGSTSTSVLITLKPGMEYPAEKSRLHLQCNVVSCQDNKAKAVINGKDYVLRFNSTFDVPLGATYSLSNESKRVNLEIMCIVKKV